MSEKILLIDGNSIINRAFYAIPLLTSNDGQYTNAVYGFLNIMFKFIDEENPEYVAVAFDLPAPTFRHKKYSEYKGTRKSMPEELRPQIPLLKSLLNKMNIEILEIEGYEADDILGTLAVKSESDDLDVTVVSGDRDMLQIASDKIKIKIPKTKGGKTEVEEYNFNEVLEKIGVTPKEYIDVKALMGDASDNIPGVPSIGEKTALKIISEYKSIENAINNANIIKPKKASENLIEFKEQAILSKYLATIITDVPIKINYNEFTDENIYNNEAFEEIKRLGFKSMFKRFEKDTPKETEAVDFKLITELNKAEKYIENILKEKLVAYTLVTVSNDVVGISFSTKKDRGTFIEFDSISEILFLEKISKFLESDIEKIALNSKFDKVYLNKKGIKVKNVIFDSMLGGYVLNSSKTTYNYNDIAIDFLGEHFESEEDIFGKGKNKKNKNEIEKTAFLNFAARQSDVIFRSYEIMKKQIEENGQNELYYSIELPLVDVLADMEIFGIKINKKELVTYQKMLGEQLEVLTKDIYLLSGVEFNINSPSQLGEILFETLGLKGGKKTKTGYSTAHDVLEKLFDKHPIIEKILEYRTISKLKSTYADGLLKIVNQEDDKIYSTFNQFIATTGRISSTEPNLQNIPIKMEIGRLLRKIFIPSNDDYIFLDGDYSQIELRVLASISGDETLINAFKNGDDIHRLTASQVFNTNMDEVTSQQRSNAKAVNFGIVYGIGAFSLSQDLSITKKEADNYIEGYFEKYPNVKKYLDDSILFATENGFAKTLFNRRRSIPELASTNFNIKSFGQRVAMNMPIQGTAADIIKIAMVKVRDRIINEKMDARLILQVHDELLLEVNKKELYKVKDIVKFEMENAVKLSAPLEVDLHSGENWYEAK